MTRPSGFERRIFGRCIVIGLCVTAIITSFEQTGLLDPLEHFLYDHRAALCQRYTSVADSQVLHLNIDNDSIREIGRWPWPRTVLADLIDELDRLGARFIALDILLD